MHDSTHHTGLLPSLLLALFLILLIAKIGGALLVRFRQPAVLGELFGGVLLGNLILFGYSGFEFLKSSSHSAEQASGSHLPFFLETLSHLGVLLLLFEVGLESKLHEMRRVGLSSLVVASLGVVVPMGLGWGVGVWLLPHESWHVHLFLGATLTATSVGITARVLKDLGKINSSEGKIILGAAVIDDVLGLIVLAVVQAIIIQGAPSVLEVMGIVFRAVGFFVGSIFIGTLISPHLFRFASRLKVPEMAGVTGLLLCLFMSWLASVVGLAPIIGAFAAGLALDREHYRKYWPEEKHSLENFILPLTAFLVPVFFVMMGLQVDLRSLFEGSSLMFTLSIIVAAVIGKQICSLGVIGKGVDRLSVGIGMIPRGEVGLIFAAIGKELYDHGKPIINSSIYSAIVLMVMVTTFITPPLLGWSLRRR